MGFEWEYTTKGVAWALLSSQASVIIAPLQKNYIIGSITEVQLNWLT